MSFLQNLFKGKSATGAGRQAVPSPSTRTGPRVSASSFLEEVEKGDLEKVKAILTSVPGLISAKESDGFGETALHKAVGKGNTEMVKLLLANKADVNVQDANHQSPLYDAVSGDHEEIVGLLLASKAAVNSRNEVGGSTPLHEAKSRKVAEMLIAHGANVHAKTEDQQGGKTPLHHAAQARVEVADTLIAHGAGVNAGGAWGSTPLHMAVQGRNKDVIRLLLAKGADAGLKDKWGRTVADLAQMQGKDADWIGLLLKQGGS